MRSVIIDVLRCLNDTNRARTFKWFVSECRCFLGKCDSVVTTVHAGVRSRTECPAVVTEGRPFTDGSKIYHLHTPVHHTDWYQ